MATVYDLSIVQADLAFGPDGEPLFLSDADAIVQDVKHRLLATGVLPELVADEGGNAAVRRRIAFAVEADERIKPGTAVTEGAPGNWNVSARTLQGVLVTQSLSA